MFDGAIVGELDAKDADERKLWANDGECSQTEERGVRMGQAKVPLLGSTWLLIPLSFIIHSPF